MRNHRTRRIIFSARPDAVGKRDEVVRAGHTIVRKIFLVRHARATPRLRIRGGRRTLADELSAYQTAKVPIKPHTSAHAGLFSEFLIVKVLFGTSLEDLKEELAPLPEDLHTLLSELGQAVLGLLNGFLLTGTGLAVELVGKADYLLLDG